MAVDGQAHSKLHALSSCSSQLSADDDLTALGTAFHDEPQNTVARSSYGEAIKELVAEGFALGDS